ncbi:MAG: preprotein translocase subunit SecG [Methyloceanibacter sp.]
MTTVLLVIHVMIAAALIGVVLLQRSEGGALGIGGGGGGFMTGRSAGNALTKTTAVLAAMFFATSLSLTVVASRQSGPTSIFDQGTSGGGGALPGLVLPLAPPAPSSAPAPQAPQSK